MDVYIFDLLTILCEPIMLSQYSIFYVIDPNSAYINVMVIVSFMSSGVI